MTLLPVLLPVAYRVSVLLFKDSTNVDPVFFPGPTLDRLKVAGVTEWSAVDFVVTATRRRALRVDLNIGASTKLGSDKALEKLVEVFVQLKAERLVSGVEFTSWPVEVRRI